MRRVIAAVKHLPCQLQFISGNLSPRFGFFAAEGPDQTVDAWCWNRRTHLTEVTVPSATAGPPHLEHRGEG
jgi:hypothetical protein